MKAIVFMLKAIITAIVLTAATGAAVCSTSPYGFFSSIMLGIFTVALVIETKFERQ